MTSRFKTEDSGSIPPGSSSALRKTKIKRSRNGCHNCKKQKIKCNEVKPTCSYCLKTGVKCDYSLKLTWGGRPYKKVRKLNTDYTTISFESKHTEPSPAKLKEKSVLEDNLQFVVEGFEKVIPQDNSLKIVQSSSLETENSIESIGSKKWSSVDSHYNDNKKKKLSVNLHPFSPKVESPASFSTPNGQSILSPYDAFNINEKPTPNYVILEELGEFLAYDGIRDLKNNTIPNKSPTLSKTFPDLSDGVESLSMILGDITNGHPQILKSSQLLNEYFDEIINPQSISPHDLKHDTVSRNEKLNNDGDTKSEIRYNLFSNLDSLSNYSEDLKATEQYNSLHSTSNFMDDYFSPSYTSIVSNNYRKRFNGFDSFDKSSINNYSNRQIQYDEDGKRIVTPEEVFASIPPQFMPLPEILLQVPFYRNLMDFWVNVAADALVPAPSQIYKDNPFKVLLPQMAMKYPSILTTILAFSAGARALLTGVEISKDIVDQLIARSCKELVLQLKSKDTAISDGTLATVLLLSCNEGFNSKDFSKHRVHTTGARQIIKARHNSLSSPQSSESDSPNSSSDRLLLSRTFKASLESDIAYFLTRWFVYIDVIGALSATKNSHYYLNPDELEIDEVNMLNGLEQSKVESKKDPKRDIDHLLGFDVRFLPQFKDVILLIRKTEAFIKQNPNSDSLPIKYISKALEVKENIMKQYYEGEARRKKKMIDVKDRVNEDAKSGKLADLIEQNNILRCTNKMFCDMAIINLYRRVLKIPRNSSIVQDIANGVLQILEDHIQSKSLAEICTIFCIFSAACETLNPKMQELALYRFGELSKMGNANAAKSLRIFERCWTTGCDWITAARDLNIDMALL